MPIHSIISLSDIFCNMDMSLPKTEYKQINGGLLEIEEFSGKKRVRRLISTDPKLYLSKKYMPYSEAVNGKK